MLLHVSIFLSPCHSCLCWLFFFFSCFYLDGKKRPRFFSWETLGEVCCSVSKEWEWNPVFLGLVSLPVPRSHPGLGVTVGIVSGLAAVLGNSRLFSLSRILGFLVVHGTYALVHSDSVSFLLLSYITLFLIILPFVIHPFSFISMHIQTTWFPLIWYSSYCLKVQRVYHNTLLMDVEASYNDLHSFLLNSSKK